MQRQPKFVGQKRIMSLAEGGMLGVQSWTPARGDQLSKSQGQKGSFAGHNLSHRSCNEDFMI